MKILTLKIEGYRSFKSQSWMPGDLNVLIGPNGGGKSNLLRALELLKHAAAGHLGRSILDEGGMEAVLWDGRAPELRMAVELPPFPPYTDVARNSLTYDLRLARIGKTSAYRIEYEALGDFGAAERGLVAQPSLLMKRDAGQAIVYSIDAQEFRASTPPEDTLLSAAAGPFAKNEFVDRFQKAVSRWGIYQNFRTDRESPIRAAAVARHDFELDGDGSNLVSVLHTLYMTSREFKESVDSAMRAAFDDFEALLFPPDASQRIQLHVRWKSLRRSQSAADLSDGTLRFLYLLAALAHPEPPPLIGLDEPEAGLHPSMLPIIAEYAVHASERSQVILATHSPEFLSGFCDTPPTTTIVEWHGGESQLKELSGESLSYWLKQYSLGELYRSNQLETMEP